MTEAEFAALQRRMGRPARKQVAPPAPTEQAEQEAVIAWARLMEPRWPELALLFHVPNGGARPDGVGRQMKRAGTRAGVPDLVLPCQRRGPDGRNYGALFVELKRADHSNGPSPLQAAWIERLRASGYMAVVAYGAAEAVAAIEHYLTL